MPRPREASSFVIIAWTLGVCGTAISSCIIDRTSGI
jgi:hypothetical protein